MLTLCQGFSYYQQPSETVDVAQSQGDVDEHDGVADHDGPDVTVALSVDLVFNAPLCTEGYGQIGIVEVLHKLDEPERHTHTE